MRLCMWDTWFDYFLVFFFLSMLWADDMMLKWHPNAWMSLDAQVSYPSWFSHLLVYLYHAVRTVWRCREDRNSCCFWNIHFEASNCSKFRSFLQKSWNAQIVEETQGMLPICNLIWLHYEEKTLFQLAHVWLTLCHRTFFQDSVDRTYYVLACSLRHL
jgi:hypothetical protein